jgi:hypothetical protein
MSILDSLMGRRTAEPGPWYMSYHTEWMNTHYPGALAANSYTPREGLEPGHWAGNWESGHAWVTTTPDWDRSWFRRNNYGVPRMIDPSRTKWQDCGGGLRKQVF